MILNGKKIQRLKTITICLIFVCTSFQGYTQNVVWVKDTLINVNLFENYEAIRRGDHYTKHGKYALVDHKNQPFIKGKYQQGSKSGFWEYFDMQTFKVIAEGNYLNNLFSGIWEYYYPNGETRLIYDFEKDNILYIDNIIDETFTSILNIQESEIDQNSFERYPTFAYPWSPRTYLQFELQKQGIFIGSMNSNGQIKILVDMFGYMKVIAIETNNELILDSMIEEIMFGYKALWIPAILDNMMTEVIIVIKF